MPLNSGKMSRGMVAALTVVTSSSVISSIGLAFSKSLATRKILLLSISLSSQVRRYPHMGFCIGDVLSPSLGLICDSVFEISAVELVITKMSRIVGTANAVAPKQLPPLELLTLGAIGSYHLRLPFSFRRLSMPALPLPIASLWDHSQSAPPNSFATLVFIPPNPLPAALVAEFPIPIQMSSSHGWFSRNGFHPSLPCVLLLCPQPLPRLWLLSHPRSPPELRHRQRGEENTFDA